MKGNKISICLFFFQAVGLVLLIGGRSVLADPFPGNAQPTDNLITQTVYGFLDFTTTIANTVMVFSPQSQPAEIDIAPTPTVKKVTKTEAPKIHKISSVVEVKTSAPPVILSSKVEVREASSTIVHNKPPTHQKEKQHGKDNSKQDGGKKVLASGKSQLPKAKNLDIRQEKAVVKSSVQTKVEVKSKAHPIVSSRVQVVSSGSSEESSLFENNLDQSEFELLSKQPSELIEETYKISELLPTKAKSGVTGLVTKLGGTIVKEGITTVHETSVIGTYISGKYAQILKSSSHVVNKVTPTIHKTLSHNHKTKLALEPSVLEDSLPLEALFTTPPSQNLVRQSRRPAVSPPFKNRLQRTSRVQQEITTEQVHTKKSSSSRPAFKLSHNRFNRPSSSSEIPTVSVFSESATPSRRFHRHRSSSYASSSSTHSHIPNSIETGSRRFKPKPSQVERLDSSTSLYKFKLTRPQGRWQYKSSPKPRVAIRRQDEDGPPIQPTPNLPDLEQSENLAEPIPEVQSTSLPTPSLPIQTIKVDISTPADFSNVYYEIATIKSPYTFQVGTVKNTRYITVTSTLEKILIEPTDTPLNSSEPLSENILTTKPQYDKDASIATLPPIAIAGDETLPLETMIETFSTSEILLKTHLLPVVRESNTTTMTLVQTYEVTKLVTATKTLPPTELFQFIPSKTLNEFNTRLDEAGSELHLELEFGDNNNNEDEDDDELPIARALPGLGNLTEQMPTLSPITTMNPPFKDQQQLSPEQLQQLAFLRLLNPNQAPVLTSTPFLQVQTIYESHVIPFFNGLSTVFSTISRPVGTVTNTQYLTSTLPQLPQIPSIPLPIFPTQQILQPQITSTPIITQTVVTATESKVLKLTFGAKTAYTTLYSTKVVPTQVTTYLTAQVPVQPTQQYPSFFPPPFNPFQFVG